MLKTFAFYFMKPLNSVKETLEYVKNAYKSMIVIIRKNYVII